MNPFANLLPLCKKIPPAGILYNQQLSIGGVGLVLLPPGELTQADNQEPDDCGSALAGGISLKFFSRVIVNEFLSVV